MNCSRINTTLNPESMESRSKFGFKRIHFRGFTIIEMMVVLSIISILAMVGVPSFIQTIRDNRLTSQANDMLGVMYFARSEAIKLNRDVQLCASNNGTSCTGTSYAEGYIIWSDDANVGVVDAAEIIRVGQGLDGGNTMFHDLEDSAVTDVVTFSSRGLSSAEGTWQICDERGALEARAIVISRSGRARVSEVDHDGGALTCA